MDIDLTEIIVAIIALLGASGGIGTYLLKRHASDEATTKLIMGLALDRIVQTGSEYVERGSLTPEEYGDYRKYLVDPYKELGGNGTADKILNVVDKLPLQTQPNRAPQTAVTFQLQREANR